MEVLVEDELDEDVLNDDVIVALVCGDVEVVVEVLDDRVLEETVLLLPVEEVVVEAPP